MKNLTENAKKGLDKLNSLLPLKANQMALTEDSRKVHRAFLRTLVEQGKAMTQNDIKSLLDTSDETVDAIIKILEDQDMLVCNCSGQPVGAYPVTTEQTPHAIMVKGHKINAMCALDSLAVSPMFQCEVKIDSTCHVTGEPLSIEQRGETIVRALPTKDIHFGIVWGSPTCGCCAHSLCTEMVFIKDAQTATEWQAEDSGTREIYTLDEAVPFASAFFVPLVQD